VITLLDQLPAAASRPAPREVHPMSRNGSGRFPVAEQLVSLIAPGSFAADQYRALRHTVERLHKDPGIQVLALTSSCPGEGKTITTLNLAGALAQSPDRRVLLIDADLHRPTVAQYLALGPDRSPGLADALMDSEFGLTRVVRRLEWLNLSILPAGCLKGVAYEMLNSPRFEALLMEARRAYDYVLIDTPPVVPLPDCRLIGRWVDGFLIIVAAHKTPRKLLSEALDLFDPSKVIGLVFNGDDRPLAGYYDYYRSYYGPSAPTNDRGAWRQRLSSFARGFARRQ
jgi:capsular exopolysaccharide synthesis family protein